ncbi:hypothetical protein BAUCODRAFT_521099 [Baudoinia panamericana UAMH 10762]|uniref:Uncharacterized protein n=1 Tax=Baudoinia panamericana (strain UAMH 10762) TaxID=717646 RepID=M2LL24_BAUPA|nr:uncharacterized protein BAUCODRAFT_521099 [Baudoinia panamericana UAMH 10762]EMC94982.1 hypothetical protein BAUCODRAFT_521099 [Baudoinia panamericana UAMH 10762]
MVAASRLLSKLCFIDMPLGASAAHYNECDLAWVKSMQGVRTIFSTSGLQSQLVGSIMGPLMQGYLEKDQQYHREQPCTDRRQTACIMKQLNDTCDASVRQADVNPYALILARLE